MRPVNKRAAPSSYKTPAILKFTGKKATAVSAVLRTATPALNDCLEQVWLVVAKWLTNKPANYKQYEDARDAIAPRVGTIYKQAAASLIQRLGSYCAYCETYIPGLIEVEHTVPKSEFPTYAVDWQNFLPSCGPCNNSKSARPSRADLQTWVGADPNHEPTSYKELRNKNRILWPDTDLDSYRDYPARLEYDATGSGTWTTVSHPSASLDLDNVVTTSDVPTLTVRADLPSLGLTNAKVRVLIDARRGTRDDDLVDICQLNDPGTPGATHDRRLFNRTLAWFEILADVNALDYWLQRGNRSAFDRAWPITLMHARNLGYYSLWVRILNEHPNNYADPSGTHASLAKRFIADAKADFPHTATAHLP